MRQTKAAVIAERNSRSEISFQHVRAWNIRLKTAGAEIRGPGSQLKGGRNAAQQPALRSIDQWLAIIVSSLEFGLSFPFPRSPCLSFLPAQRRISANEHRAREERTRSPFSSQCKLSSCLAGSEREKTPPGLESKLRHSGPGGIEGGRAKQRRNYSTP